MRSVFKFLNAPMIYNAKSVFLAVNASLCWLYNVSGVYLIQVSLLLIGQQSVRFGTFLLLEDCASALLYKHQANPLLSMNNYTPLAISENDKNKQLKNSANTN
jgi:hypothetical protein